VLNADDFETICWFSQITAAQKDRGIDIRWQPAHFKQGLKEKLVEL
jgi:hypothetical protein